MADYLGVVTLKGQAKIAGAIGGTPLQLAAIAVGDGNGNETSPNETQTTLVREVWRGAITASGRDAVNPNIWRVKTIIPENVGPFDLREIAVFDQSGEMIAIARHPRVAKITAAQGAAVSIETAIIFPVSDTASVILALDAEPTIVGVERLRRPFHLTVDSATVTAPPGSPAPGATYFVPANPTGAWAGQAGKLAQWEGEVWAFAAIPDGHVMLDRSVPAPGPMRYLTKFGTVVLPEMPHVIQSGAWNYAVTGGSSAAYTANLIPAPPGIPDGFRAVLGIHTRSDYAPTLNLNNSGPLPLRWPNDEPVDAEELPTGGTITVTRRGAVWHADLTIPTRLSGDVTGSGTGAVPTTLVNVGQPGTYGLVQTDSKGRVVAGRAAEAGDIVNFGDTVINVTETIYARGQRFTFLRITAGGFNTNVPADCHFMEAQVLGGGGAGGSADALSAAGSGGAGGGYSFGVYPVSPGQPISGQVGGGGAARPAGSTEQAPGGGTSFVSGYNAATGGAGGYPGIGNIANTVGLAGIGSGGQYDRQGGGAGLGYESGAGKLGGGFGGAGFGYGNNGPNVGAPGIQGQAPGNGGNGASANAPGGNGRDGEVRLTFY